MKLNEFDNTKNIDISKIKYDYCKNQTKFDTFNKDFIYAINII